MQISSKKNDCNPQFDPTPTKPYLIYDSIMVMINAKQVLLYFELRKLSVKLQNHYVVNVERLFNCWREQTKWEETLCVLVRFAYWISLGLLAAAFWNWTAISLSISNKSERPTARSHKAAVNTDVWPRTQQSYYLQRYYATQTVVTKYTELKLFVLYTKDYITRVYTQLFLNFVACN